MIYVHDWELWKSGLKKVESKLDQSTTTTKNTFGPTKWQLIPIQMTGVGAQWLSNWMNSQSSGLLTRDVSLIFSMDSKLESWNLWLTIMNHDLQLNMGNV